MEPITFKLVPFGFREQSRMFSHLYMSDKYTEDNKYYEEFPGIAGIYPCYSLVEDTEVEN